MSWEFTKYMSLKQSQSKDCLKEYHIELDSTSEFRFDVLSLDIKKDVLGRLSSRMWR